MVGAKTKRKEDTENDAIPDEPINEVAQTPKTSVESVSPDHFVEPPMKIMPTLPQSFKSLVGRPIDIKNGNRKPHDIIELLGDALGVDDYQTNMASFWFLDFIALQVLRYESVLDNHGRSVMVSWLAGEMKFIQERTFSREAFFRHMEDIFMSSSKNLSRGSSLLHWNLMMVDYTGEDISTDEEIVREQAEVCGAGTLDVIIEATYSMYGNSFLYALIVAAFVRPVQLHEYTLPFTFRAPRPVRMFEAEKPDDKKINKSENSAAARKGKESKKAKDSKKPKKKSKDSETINVPPQPTQTILIDEEILRKKREFILPLMKANEASDIIAAYREVNSQSKKISGPSTKL